MAYTSTITFGNAVGGGAPAASAITAESINFGFENPASLSTGTAGGKVTYSPLTFTKGIDDNSVALYEACTSGTAFETLTLTIQPSGAASPVITYLFGTVLITQVNISGNQHGGLTPTETIVVEYGNVSIPSNSSAGSPSGGWNRVINTSG